MMLLPEQVLLLPVIYQSVSDFFHSISFCPKILFYYVRYKQPFVGGLIGTATPSKDGLIPRELMPISVDTTDSKSLFLLASFSSDGKFIATFVISVNKTQYVQPYSYIVSFSYNPSYGLSNALNTNGKYSKGATPFYYKQTSNTIQLFINTETYCPIDIIPLSVTGGTITFEESSESTSNLTRF